MQFYDQHCHSRLSFDSQVDPYDYIQPGREKIVLTDHLDLANPYTGNDDIPDFDQLFAWKEDMAESYNVELLAGVEIGYVPGQEEWLEEVLSPYDFDIQLLSCHQNLRHDYMDPTSDEDPWDRMDQYVDQVYQAVTQFKRGQIMTHFDYGFRIHEVTVDQIQGRYQDQYVAIFEAIFKRDMAMELNAKSILGYGKADLYDWAIPLYLSLGGQLFTLGSDCHVVEDLMLGFDQLKALLMKHGVGEVALYNKQGVNLVPLAELEFND